MKQELNKRERRILDRLYHKNIYCVSDKYVKWAKKYMNRSRRRKDKQKGYEGE